MTVSLGVAGFDKQLLGDCTTAPHNTRSLKVSLRTSNPLRRGNWPFIRYVAFPRHAPSYKNVLSHAFVLIKPRPMKSMRGLNLLIITALVCGCAEGRKADVPLSYAKLDTGYLNSGIYDLGWVFVWDRTQKTLTAVGPLKVPEGLKDVGPTIEQQQTTLSADTDVEFSADIAKIVGTTASLQAQIARNTTTELDNVARETAAAEALLNFNNQKSRTWRQRLAKDYAGDNFRFLVIDRVLRGDKVSVGFNNTGAGSVGANVLQYGGLNIKVTYSGKSNFTQTGKGAPLVIQARMFQLTGKSADPEFVPVTGAETKQFNFQQAIKQGQ